MGVHMILNHEHLLLTDAEFHEFLVGMADG